MVKQKLIYKEPWQLMAERWKKYSTPPARPTKGDLVAYKKFIKQAAKGKRRPKVLVMGATPELRDLLYELKCEVTIIDVFAEMIKAMSALRKHQNAKEKIIVSDWIDNPLASDYFDVIIGDVVLENLPWDKHKSFLQGIARMLKPGGYFISRFFLIPDGYKPITMENFLKECKNFLPKHKNSALEMIFAAYRVIYDRKHKLFDLRILKNKIKKYWRKNKFVHPDKKIEYILNLAWEIWKPMEKVYATDFEKNIAKFVSQYFSIEEKGFFTEVFWSEAAKLVPIWSCRVKK
jgi:SAM-dependent methyltransferase